MMVLAAAVLFFVTGAAHAVDLDDLGVTIKMIDSDDVKAAGKELRLPDAASDVAREHAEKRDGKGLSRANEVHERNESRKSEHDNKDDDKDHSADKKDDQDEHKSSRDDSKESHDEAKESQEEMKEEQSESHDESKDDHTDAKDDMDDKADSSTSP
jgi:hypothetical protein